MLSFANAFSRILGLLHSVPFFLSLSGVAFFLLDGLALYQLIRLHAPSAAAACPSTYLVSSGRQLALQQQQQQLSLLQKVWGRVAALFSSKASTEAASTTFCTRAADGNSNYVAAPAAAAVWTSQPTTAGGQTRFAFMLLLFAAILARASSLFCMAYIASSHALVQPENQISPPSAAAATREEESNPISGESAAGTQPRQQQDLGVISFSFSFTLDDDWYLLFLDSAPALLFFSSLSLVVLFWAKIYYASLLVAYPRLEKGHWLCSAGLLFFYLLFLFFAVILQAKRSATEGLQFFSALLFALGGGAFLLYGLKVAKKLSERTKLSARKSSIVKRVSFLSLACPVLFGARSFMALRGITPPLHPLLSDSSGSLFAQPLVAASTIFLLTEWVPALLILAAFWHRKSKSSNTSMRSQQQRLLQRQHQREAYEKTSNIATPLMQQHYLNASLSGPAARAFFAPQPAQLIGPAAISQNGGIDQQLQQQQQEGVTYQPYMPGFYQASGGVPTPAYAIPPLYSPYKQQYYPPSAF